MCDSQFHMQSLKDMLECDEKYGFIVIDGNGALYANIQGPIQEILYQYNVSLPKKHSKGGQSSVRFARLRVEARHNYLTKVNELAVKFFWDQDKNKPSVNGIVLAGSADFKDQLNNHRLDQRLQKIVINVVDVAYGGHQGLNQAIILASDSLRNVALVKQKKLFSKFFEEIATDSGKYCFGAKDTMNSVEGGMAEIILVWEKLGVIRHTMRNKITGISNVVYKNREENPENDGANNLEVTESVPLIEWLVDHYKEFGAKLEIVQDSSGEGSQFCTGFGGIGALLRYRQEFVEPEIDEEVDNIEDDLSEYFDGEDETLDYKAKEDAFF